MTTFGYHLEIQRAEKPSLPALNKNDIMDVLVHLGCNNGIP